MSGKFENRSRGFKVMALALAFVLVIGASVAGTLAWLTAQTTEVKNTFTSAELIDTDDKENPGSFTLWEHEAVLQNDGTYKLNEEKEVTGNTYKVLPGVDIPKDPTVDVVNLEAYAYLYIKVTSSLPTGMTYTIDDANWEEVNDYNGVYVYKGTEATNNVIQATSTDMKTFTVNILKDKEVKVAADYAGTADVSLAFEAYLVQATGNGENAAAAWANTYGAQTQNP